MNDVRITALALAARSGGPDSVETFVQPLWRTHFEKKLVLIDLLAELSETRRTAFVRHPAPGLLLC